MEESSCEIDPQPESEDELHSAHISCSNQPLHSDGPDRQAYQTEAEPTRQEFNFADDESTDNKESSDHASRPPVSQLSRMDRTIVESFDRNLMDSSDGLLYTGDRRLKQNMTRVSTILDKENCQRVSIRISESDCKNTLKSICCGAHGTSV